MLAFPALARLCGPWTQMRGSGWPPPGRSKPEGRVDIFSRAELASCPCWTTAFAACRKDHRYYELVEDTVCPHFKYRYFAIRDGTGRICAIQPYFVIDQDLLMGSGSRRAPFTAAVRAVWPRFLVLRTLMVGCAVGEGQLSEGEAPQQSCHIELLAQEIISQARKENAALIVLKEFPARYRMALSCFLSQGFTRVPSLPMTRLNIGYASFDEYMTKALKSAARAKLRRKFRAAERAEPISMEVAADVSGLIDELYPLYVQVYNRSNYHFEELTKGFFSELGRRMPDKVRFFVWRKNRKIVAFILCMLEGDAIYAEYIGLDYSVALDWHLYHYAVRGVITWAIANGFKWFRSGGLNYDPKLQMRHLLDPIDLYVRHRSPVLNAILKQAMPLLQPIRHHKALRKFLNYQELWA